MFDSLKGRIWREFLTFLLSVVLFRSLNIYCVLDTVLASKNTKKKKKEEEGCEKEGRREGGIIIVFYLGSREAKNDTDIIKSLY